MTRSSVCARLDLEPAGAAAAGLVRRVERLDHHALVAARRARPRANASRLAASSATTRGTRSRLGHAPSSAAARSAPRRSSRSSPSTCSTSKKSGVSGTRRASRVAPMRDAVTWNGSRPAVGAQRDRLAVEHERACAGSARAAATISGTRPVMSSRLRVKTRDVVAVAVHLHAAPSSFHSTAAGPSCASASGRLAPCRPASAAAAGRPRARTPAARPRPRASAAAATAREVAAQHQRAAHVGERARRPPRATASAITPSSAPWRSSPASSRAQERLLARAVARANSAREQRAPLGLRAGAGSGRCASKAASTSSDGQRRLGGRRRQRRAARPSRRRSGAAAGRPRGRRRRRAPRPAPRAERVGERARTLAPRARSARTRRRWRRGRRAASRNGAPPACTIAACWRTGASRSRAWRCAAWCRTSPSGTRASRPWPRPRAPRRQRARATAVLAAVRSGGRGRRDVGGGIGVGPRWEPGKRRASGWEASGRVGVRTGLDGADAAGQAALDAGAETLEGPYFEIAGERAIRDERTGGGRAGRPGPRRGRWRRRRAVGSARPSR